jgi:hypothetical protein
MIKWWWWCFCSRRLLCCEFSPFISSPYAFLSEERKIQNSSQCSCSPNLSPKILFPSSFAFIHLLGIQWVMTMIKFHNENITKSESEKEHNIQWVVKKLNKFWGFLNKFFSSILSQRHLMVVFHLILEFFDMKIFVEDMKIRKFLPLNSLHKMNKIRINCIHVRVALKLVKVRFKNVNDF